MVINMTVIKLDIPVKDLNQKCFMYHPVNVPIFITNSKWENYEVK